MDEATGQQLDIDDAAPVEEAEVSEETDTPETVESGSDQLEVEGDEALPVVGQGEEPAEEEVAHEYPLSPAALREDLNKLDASLNAFAQAYNATVGNINGMQQQMIQGFAQFQRWIQNAENTLNNHNIRVNVIETLLVHEEFVEKLAAAIAPAVRLVVDREHDGDRLTIKDMHVIAKEHVMPALKAQYEKAVAEAKKRQQQAQADAEAAETGLVGPDGSTVSSKSAGNVVGLDGRPIQSEGPATVGMDDDD